MCTLVGAENSFATATSNDQPMSGSGQTLRSYSAYGPTFVRCSPKADIERRIQDSIWLAVYEPAP
jgi:hypothetical protein